MMTGKIITREEMLAIPAVEISDLDQIAPEPLVSVILITYNHEAYIEQAIEGILAQQGNFPIELIIAEDNSQDRTLAICLDYQKRYPHLIRLVTWRENVGFNPNFLRVWGRARGKYAALCEGDDYWIDPAKLKKQVALMEESPETILSGATTLWLDSSKNDLPGAVFGPMQMKCRYGLEDVIARPCFHTSTFMFRRSEFKIPACTRSIGIMMDTLLMSAAALQGSLKCILDTVSAYRVHTGGLFSTLSLSRKYEQTIEMLQAILTFADEKYHPIIKKKVDAVRTWLCFELVSNGQVQRARRLAWQTVRSLALHTPRRALVLIFHVYLPRTSRLVIDAWNRRKPRFAAASVPLQNGDKGQR